MLRPLYAPLPIAEPRRRGGWRQRIEREEQNQELPGPGALSHLFGLHLLDWCDGKMSASRLQQCAAAGLADNFVHPMIQRLAGVGAAQHANAGILGLLNTCGIPAYIRHYPGEEVTHALLPSQWVRIIMQYPHEFQRRFGADRAKLRSFWSDFLARPCNADIVRDHPAIRGKTLDQLETMVPLVAHTDGAPFSKTSSCNCLSFSALLGEGDEKLTRFLIASHVKVTGNCNTRIWEHVIEDFLAMRTGVVDGNEIARDSSGTLWEFAFLFMLQDEDVRCNEFGLTHYSGAHEVCSECMANRTGRPFTDLRPCACWRPSERMTFLTYRERLRVPLHPLAASPFFCHRWFFSLDLMHLMDCKGSAALTYGGIIAFLLQDDRLGTNRLERLATINDRRLLHYARRPGVSRLPKIFLSNVTADGWADLHGPAFKAAITRQAAPFFDELVCQYCASDEPADVLLRSVAGNLNSIYRVLYAAPLFPSDADLRELRGVVQAFGTSYQRLHELSRRLHRMAFIVKPKIHKAQHLPLYAACINPTAVQCYAEESQMGTTVKCWKGSVAGRYKAVVQLVVLVKRVIALLLRFELAVLR